MNLRWDGYCVVHLRSSILTRRRPMKRPRLSSFALSALALALSSLAPTAVSQSVLVTATLDSPSVAVGQPTTLRVFAQIKPELRATSDRIFSWYVDIVNTNGLVATANYAALTKAA